MPPIVKENEVPGTTPENSAARTSTKNGQPDETANRPQPVALEVPVTVNGARTIEGSDKREPFSEATKTVLIFGSGAVIRLSSPVAPGQLLFLTNEKTKKEVVCQVVKSKNYRSVSGYVELEFTEPVVGFWGMRFPGDRAVTPPTPAAAGSPGAVPPSPPKAISPVASAAPKATEVKSTPIPLAAKPVETKSGEVFGSTPAVKTVPPAPKMPTVIAPAGIEVPNAPQAKPTVPTAAKQEPLPTTGQGSTEALKLQAAQLQEQLSSMLFTGNQAAPQTSNGQTATSPGKTRGSEAAGKVLEMAKVESTAAKPMLPAKVSPPPIKSSLDAEEVKIPAWLEPLARNTAAPASTQELLEREKAKLTTKPVEPQEPKAGPEAKTETESVTAVPEMVPSRETEGGELGLYSFEKEFNDEESASGGTKKGLWIGLAAAGILTVATGGWYFYKQKPAQQTAAVTTPAAPNTQQLQTVAQGAIPTPVSPTSNASANPSTNAASSGKPEANAVVSNLQPPTATAPGTDSTEKGNLKAGANTRDVKGVARAVPAAETEIVLRTAEPAQRKAVLGKVHLATPKVNRATTQQDSGTSEPTLSPLDMGTNAGTLGPGLAITNAKQPAAPEAPLPVGGDVKPAKLASSVSPIYPALARSQHVSGDVKIDALIDANGRVTSMKVIAGPTLLHQSAMDALRQWKYQPATLDGKPVPMHLTVTLQFRLQ